MTYLLLLNVLTKKCDHAINCTFYMIQTDYSIILQYVITMYVKLRLVRAFFIFTESGQMI